MKLQDVPTIHLQDMATMFARELIGSGMSRNVYVYAYGQDGHEGANDFVLKFEFGAGHFQNTKEWLVWTHVKHYRELSRWFAPCNSISDMGRWLLQHRTTPVSIDELRKKLPRVPAVFADLKVGNWGRIGKRIVCHDYGTCLITQEGVTAKTRKAEWWE